MATTGENPVKVRCGQLNPWCECCGCEKKPGHRGRHRITYSPDRIVGWDDSDEARVAAGRDKAFRTRLQPYVGRYKKLMEAGRMVRVGDAAVASKADEHRLHGGLIMLHGLIVDAVVAFRSHQVRMSDDELRATVGTLFGDYAEDLLDTADGLTPPGVTVNVLECWYGVRHYVEFPLPPVKVRVGRHRLNF